MLKRNDSKKGFKTYKSSYKHMEKTQCISKKMQTKNHLLLSEYKIYKINMVLILSSQGLVWLCFKL